MEVKGLRKLSELREFEKFSGTVDNCSNYDFIFLRNKFVDDSVILVNYLSIFIPLRIFPAHLRETA